MPYLALLAILFLTACSSPKSGNTTSLASLSFSEEPRFCAQEVAISNGVQLSGHAQFYARQVSSAGLLGPGPAQDIKWAEVQVLNSQGQTVQCSTTSDTGLINLTMPNAPGAYVLKVLSRADSAKYKASILNNPSANLPYSIEKSFSLTGKETSISVSLPIAPFDGTLQGGAFNLLDQVYLANEFIRNNSTCPDQSSVCNPFSVAPKVRIYWTPGLSPYSYYGSPSIALSFYAKEDDPAVGLRQGMYIQGGINGDVDCSDTDHFDNSVILHEYGHFLESAFGKSDSPGGSHNGNGQIDPRLAWSEGWANFFQSAVFKTPEYKDTIGNSNCAGGTFLGISLNMETPQPGQDKMPIGSQMGEGLFREVSVSRTLWDIMDSSGTDGGAGLGFPLVWKVFSDSNFGFRNANLHFRNMGMFNQFLHSLTGQVWPAKLGALDGALANEYQPANQSEYALPLTPISGGTCSFNLQGVADSYQMGNWVSNLLKSNDFFQINYDGSYNQLELHYSGTNPSDLDLYLYSEEYVFDDPTTILRKSQKLYPEVNNSGYEVVDMTGLASGTYLVNVRVNTNHLGQTANYYLSTPLNSRLCP